LSDGGGVGGAGLGGSSQERRRNLEAIAFLALILTFSSVSFFSLVTRPISCFPGDIGTVKCPITTSIVHDTTPLGVWKSMPACPVITDSCELMGNASYRGTLVFSIGGQQAQTSAILSVGCVIPSNTLGAVLQLQYANYSVTSRTNITNFINLGSAVPVDNSATWPCPGNLEIGTGGTLPAIVQGFIFRVIGSGGGGTGDNPRFSSITVNIYQQIVRLRGFTSSIRLESVIIMTRWRRIAAWVTRRRFSNSSRICRLHLLARTWWCAGRARARWRRLRQQGSRPSLCPFRVRRMIING